MGDRGLTRRNLLTHGTAFSVAASTDTLSASAAAALAAPGAAGLVGALTPLDRYMLVRGALDNRPVIASLRGVYYATQKGIVTPLLGLILVSFASYRRNSDSTMTIRLAEVGHYTNLSTGAVMREWRNEMTGEMCQLPTPRERHVTQFSVGPDLVTTLANVPGFHQSVNSVREEGDDLWIEECLSYAPPIGQPGVPLTELVTYHARRSDFSVRGTTRVRSEVTFVVTSGWRPWLRMGDRPGSLVLTCKGRTKIEVSELPPLWIAATQPIWPELLSDLVATLAG